MGSEGRGGRPLKVFNEKGQNKLIRVPRSIGSCLSSQAETLLGNLGQMVTCLLRLAVSLPPLIRTRASADRFSAIFLKDVGAKAYVANTASSMRDFVDGRGYLSALRCGKADTTFDLTTIQRNAGRGEALALCHKDASKLLSRALVLLGVA